MSGGRLTPELLVECGEWVWEQLQEEGVFLSGELVDLILATERELGVQARPLEEIARILDEEFRMRGITGSPVQLDTTIIRAVVEWEDEFLGFAGIARADS